jgi:hypothetical protein
MLEYRTPEAVSLMLMTRVEPATESGGDDLMVTSMKREDDGSRWRR